MGLKMREKPGDNYGKIWYKKDFVCNWNCYLIMLNKIWGRYLIYRALLINAITLKIQVNISSIICGINICVGVDLCAGWRRKCCVLLVTTPTNAEALPRNLMCSLEV